VPTLKNATVFTSIYKRRYRSVTYFWCLSNSAQPPRDWKGATVHDQVCPCMRGFRWRSSGAFVVNCDLIHYNKSTVIKLGTFSLMCYVSLD
jgi:hypothetical protein